MCPSQTMTRVSRMVRSCRARQTSQLMRWRVTKSEASKPLAACVVGAAVLIARLSQAKWASALWIAQTAAGFFWRERKCAKLTHSWAWRSISERAVRNAVISCWRGSGCKQGCVWRRARQGDQNRWESARGGLFIPVAPAAPRPLAPLFGAAAWALAPL
jgi:hypothetical protein